MSWYGSACIESYREGGKVKQRVVADLGRKDLLLEVLPGLRRVLLGEEPGGPGEDDILDASTWGPISRDQKTIRGRQRHAPGDDAHDGLDDGRSLLLPRLPRRGALS